MHACRLLAGKSILAARIDSVGGHPTGNIGRALRDKIHKTIEKWQEPPPAKRPKPLLVPDCKPKKKRGGWRLRSDGIGEGYGMLGQAGNGRLRVSVAKSKLAAKLAKNEGNENFLLLCDAVSHTFYVRLGATVPEGDWYDAAAFAEMLECFRKGSLSFTSKSSDRADDTKLRNVEGGANSSGRSSQPHCSGNYVSERGSYDVVKAWKMLDAAKSMEQVHRKTSIVLKSSKDNLSKVITPVGKAKPSSSLLVSNRCKAEAIITLKTILKFNEISQTSQSPGDHIPASVLDNVCHGNVGKLTEGILHAQPADGLHEHDESVWLVSPAGPVTSGSNSTSAKLEVASSSYMGLPNEKARMEKSCAGSKSIQEDDAKSEIIQSLVKLNLKLPTRDRPTGCHSNQVEVQQLRRMSTVMPSSCRECFYVFVKDVVNLVMVFRVVEGKRPSYAERPKLRTVHSSIEMMEHVGDLEDQTSISIDENEVPLLSDSEDDSFSSLVFDEFEVFKRNGLTVIEGGNKCYKIINGCVAQGMGKDTNVAAVHKIPWSSPNKRLEAFRISSAEMVKKCGGNGNIKHAWYGGSRDEICEIISHGFRRCRQSYTNGEDGYGVYLYPLEFVMDGLVSSIEDENGLRHLLLCNVILGNMEEVRPASRQFKPSSNEFDSGVDDLSKPSRIVIWEAYMNSRIFPSYVVSFTAHNVRGCSPSKKSNLPPPLNLQGRNQIQSSTSINLLLCYLEFARKKPKFSEMEHVGDLEEQTSISIDKNEIPFSDSEDDSFSSPVFEEFGIFRRNGLTRIEEGSKCYEIINGCVAHTSGQDKKVAAVHKVPWSGPNGQLEAFRASSTEMVNRCGGGNGNIKHSWYGGSRDELCGIISHGFHRCRQSDNNEDGYGVYLQPLEFVMDGLLSSAEDEYGLQHILLCNVVLGKMEEVRPGSRQFEPSSNEFDAGVDDLSRPTRFIIWEAYMNSRIFPSYVVSFRAHLNVRGLGRDRTPVYKPTTQCVEFSVLIPNLAKVLPPLKMTLISKYQSEFRPSLCCFYSNSREAVDLQLQQIQNRRRMQQAV
ncbi:hypothetical protein RHSIM_Rhsim12G0147800 [Rhododendron simsii]|uniref:Poly [ADP-ribose] polymerase n=1 Tax=Rhododendron simsii TaxID=118357 RepID=A0A834L8I0_RHOSS|nr:hypothetical protein RHSIM_Rhsim12G0147800 [Rhododendron simsii]